MLGLNRPPAQACVASVACVNIMGTSLGLRGPDGSMLQAADGMHKQTLGEGKLCGSQVAWKSGLVLQAALVPDARSPQPT